MYMYVYAGGMAPKGNPIYAYRSGKWQQVSTKDLLPGDLISLSFNRTQFASSSSEADKTKPAIAAAAKPTTGAGDAQVTFVWDGSIPCDCLLLKGSAVVNEASLTGKAHTYIYRHGDR